MSHAMAESGHFTVHSAATGGGDPYAQQHQHQSQAPAQAYQQPYGQPMFSATAGASFSFSAPPPKHPHYGAPPQHHHQPTYHTQAPYQPSFSQLMQQAPTPPAHHQTQPLPQQYPAAPAANGNVVFIGDRCARLWGMLWHSDFKLRISIPDSILFCNGSFHSYLFSSTKNRGEIRKKKGMLSLEEIRECLVERTEKDASNVTPYVAILQSHDSSLMPVPYTSLPRILRSIGSLPREDRIAQASFGGVPKRNDEVDLYQVVRAYVHPLCGLRFMTTYKFQGDAPDTSNMTSHAQPQAPGAKPRHSISTVCGRFADRYQVLPEERAFFDSHEELSHQHSGSSLPPVPDSLARECERITLCVVEWLSRIHGVGCKTLQLEFIQNFNKRLLLHSVIEVVFQPEPTLDITPSLGLQLLAAVNDQGEEKQQNTTPPLHDMPATDTSGNPFQVAYAASSTYAPSAYPVPPASAFAEDYSSYPSSAMPSRAPSRPASATVRPSSAAGRAGRHAKAAQLGNSASSATFSAPYAQTARASRPSSARPTASEVSTARASDDLEENFRNTQPPRGFVGIGGASTLPRTARAKIMRDASKSGLQFSTLMQFETRTEMDERLSRGGLRPPASGVAVANTDGTPAASAGGRADFLLFHWRSQARSAQDEIVRLNEELAESSRKWQQKETQLMSLLHMEEKKVSLLATQNQTSQMENQTLRHDLDSLRLSSTQRQLEQEATIGNLRQEVEVNQLVIKRLEELKKRNADELLAVVGEKGTTEGQLDRLHKEKADLARMKQRAEHELTVAQKVRDELLEKLESEEQFARNLAQQLDMMADFDAFEDMKHLFQKASSLARSEGNRLKEMEALRAQVVKYTKDRGWQEKKAGLQKQAKALKKSAMAGDSRAGNPVALVDPVPERRATDIIYERALNRMAH